MHMCWLGGHFDAEYTPSEERRRGAKASLSVIRLPSCRKTASVSAASRSPRPRTRSDPCSATKARSALRCSDAQRSASPVTSTRRIGGLPGCRSTLGGEVGDEEDNDLAENDDISSSPFQSIVAARDEGDRSGTARSLCTNLSSTSMARSARTG